MGQQRSIVFLAQIWPEYRSSGAGVRTFSLVKACLEAGWSVNFLASSKPNSYSQELQALGVEATRVEPNSQAFAAIFAELKPDIALFDRFMTEEQFAWQVREASPETALILDTIDLHFLRQARANGEAKDTSYREIASLYRSDLSLVISSYEYSFLQERFAFPEFLLGLVPFFYPPARFPRRFEERGGFVFMGNYRHAPNFEAAQNLAKEIWPLIRSRLPNAFLHLYGAYAPKEISELHRPEEGLHFMGQAADQYATFSRYRVNLAPLRFGAGLKGKIADGWSVGTPCITTPVGAEGMGEDSSWGGFVRDLGEDFAEAAVMLHEEKEEWKKKSCRSGELLQQLFSEEREKKHFLSLLELVLASKNERREENFLGSMLWHHSLQSQKYFSKWIEEKQKNQALKANSSP